MRFTELCESFDFSARPGNDHTRNQPVVRFTEIIRSSRFVRAAFDKAPAYRWWWRAILVLHGKPCRDDLSTADRRRILSHGFRFYAMLYILLALIMVAVSVFLVAFKVTEGFYWPGMALFAGIYLGGSSGLAFKGARLYPSDTRDALGLLVVFFVAVIGFLMALGEHYQFFSTSITRSLASLRFRYWRCSCCLEWDRTSLNFCISSTLVVDKMIERTS